MRKLFILGLSLAYGLYASHSNIDRYLDYLPASHFGRVGDCMKGEMQIVEGYDAILRVQENYYEELIKKGFSPEEAKKYSRVGVVEEDRHWIWLRDPLILPNGKTTAYNRFFPKSGFDGVAGVSVMGISKEKEILVNVIFRHATREWEIELPRGGRGRNETSEHAALRELEEETGIRAKQAFKIASIAPDSGILSNFLDLYVVSGLSSSEKINREECEIIDDCIFLSKSLLKQAFVDGFIELDIKGNRAKVFCRDPYLASGLLIAEARSLL